MKIICIYHSIDLDGWMSAAIVKLWFEQSLVITNSNIDSIVDKIDFIGYNYGQPIPDLSKYDKVIMCDISFPYNNMKELYRSKNTVIWIDHHISAINMLPLSIEGLRDTKFAACELTWEYFLPYQPMPEIVRLLGLYDSFQHKGTDEETKVLEFQYGARQCISNYEEAYSYLLKSLNPLSEFSCIENDIYNNGKKIYQYLCTEAKQSYKNGFAIYFRNDIKRGSVIENGILKFICINKERFNPINFGIDYHADGYDGCACFHYANGMWNFSLYNDNGEVDCSVIATQYGGGGHKGAAGFRLNMTEFIKLLNK